MFKRLITLEYLVRWKLSEGYGVVNYEGKVTPATAAARPISSDDSVARERGLPGGGTELSFLDGCYEE